MPPSFFSEHNYDKRYKNVCPQIPADIVVQVRRRLPEALLRIVDWFNSAYAVAF